MKAYDMSAKKRLRDAPYHSEPIDQLYHPTAILGSDGFDLLYARDMLGTTKFDPILLKEWFFLVQENGHLVIDYQPSKHIDFTRLETNMWHLWKGNYEIVFHGAITERQARIHTTSELRSFIQDAEKLPPQTTQRTPRTPKGYIRFICRKTGSTTIADDSISRWTFGIITNGVRLDLIEQIIASIKAQRIPHYEIILCGNYHEREESNIHYIPFNQRDDLGWISRKKNLIVLAAQYENLCIIHDRIAFDKEWYEGMKKWGNTFEHLTCLQYFEGKRTNDWLLHEKIEGIEYTFCSQLDPRDWDQNACQGGQMHIVKKKYALECPWDESYMWGRPEDVKLTSDLYDSGRIIRCSPHSTMTTLLYKFGDLPRVQFDAQKLSHFREGNKIRIFSRNLYRLIARSNHLQKLVLYGTKHLTKNSFLR